MSGKQMEGDNPRRRALAREAREDGRSPSEAGVTLGASQQPESEIQARRQGPPPAGAHKPQPGQEPPLPQRSAPGPSWPNWDPARTGIRERDGDGLIPYRDLIAEVGHHLGTTFDQARTAAKATVTALARTLNEDDRQRLLGAVPAELWQDYPVDVPQHPDNLASFINELVGLAYRTPERARYQAEAVLVAMARRNPDLMESLHLPDDVRQLFAPLPTGGGLVETREHTAPLTEDELSAALHELPYWSGDLRGLIRPITLPRDNLERVLQRLSQLKEELGRGPHIGRQDESTAVLVVRTRTIDGVSQLDVDLAHRIDDAIQEAAAGIGS